jgi:hypothetical protein
LPPADNVWRRKGGLRARRGRLRPLLGLVGSALSACAAEPMTILTTTMDGSIDAPDQTFDVRPFESGVSVTCVSYLPRTIPRPPELLVLLDRSASMNDSVDGPGVDARAVMSKWTQLTSAVGRLVAATDAAAAWGLMFLGGGEGPSACAVPDVLALAPVLHAAPTIEDAIAHAQPAGSTPFALAVEVAARSLASRDTGAPKYLVLATDGQATCGSSPCATPSSEALGTCDDDAAVAAIGAARARGIATFVIGVAAAGSAADRTLSAMATAGGYPRATQPPYYPVTRDDTVDTTLAPIAAATSCSFEISPPLTADYPINAVTVDGVAVDLAAYKVHGQDGLELTGQTCADYVTGKVRNVAIHISCTD